MEATETAEGYTGDVYCTDCNELISKGKIIDKIVVEPPVTESPITEPIETEPPITEPPITEPPETKSLITDPPVTKPPVTEPPQTNPPVNDTTESLQTTESPETAVDGKPKIISGMNMTFRKNSNDSLVFISDADFNEFIRVEIDGNILSGNDYTAESGSTVITVKSDYLNLLSNGEHTVSIISASGNAEAEFTVRDSLKTDDGNTSSDTDESSEGSPNDETNKFSTTHIVTIIIIIVIVICGVALLFLTRGRRTK